MSSFATIAAFVAALALLTGCSSIGSVKLQGSYLMGAGSDQREIRAGINFKLRRAGRADGKSLVAARMSPAEPNCAGGTR